MIVAYIGGHAVTFRNGQYVYIDTGELAGYPPQRPCPECGMAYSRCEACGDEAHDPCLGHLDGVGSACCGHGVERPYLRSSRYVAESPISWAHLLAPRD